MDTDTGDDLRDRAIKNLHAKQSFQVQLATFFGVSVFLIVIWAISDGGFFWPAIPILAWGLFGLVPQWWRLYRGSGMNEDQIQKEMNRIGGGPEA